MRFVPLAAIRDPELVLPTIAQTLGLIALGGQSPAAGLRIFLRERELLLVLDNMEQVVSAAPELAQLLSSCPGLTLLVTSRETLRIEGEQEFPVPPLDLPDSATSTSSPEFAACEAVAYFVQRARAVKPTFILTEENAPAVAEICAWLDGLPLALELAASRIKLLPPHQLLARLSDRLTLLSRDTRDVPARLRTMRDAIAWSYDLLSPTNSRSSAAWRSSRAAARWSRRRPSAARMLSRLVSPDPDLRLSGLSPRSHYVSVRQELASAN